jgi:hypothetical protein
VTPRRPRPLCAICADREATTITDWECASGATRTIVACWPCLSPVPDPPEEYEPADLAARVRDRDVAPGIAQQHLMRDAVLATVRELGRATTTEIRAHLDYKTRAEQNHVTKVLSRLVKAGALIAEELYPGSPTAGRVYVATGASPISPEMVAAREALAAAPDVFMARDVGIGPAAIGQLARDGFIVLERDTYRDDAGAYVPRMWRKTRKEQPRAA